MTLHIEVPPKHNRWSWDRQGSSHNSHSSRISAADVAAAKAVPIAQLIAQSTPVNGRGYARCIFHAEKTPSLHILRKENVFHCFGCGAGGDTISWVERVHRVSFVDAVRILLGHAVADSRVTPSSSFPSRDGPDRDSARVRKLVTTLWRYADNNAIAEFYLESRGIRLRPKPLPPSLKGHSRVWCSETKDRRPAMLAAVTDESGAVTAVQRTWCDLVLFTVNGKSPEKGTRAALEAPKKTLGRLGNGAVRLGEPGDVLGLAEGVESALSASLLFLIPVWAVLGLGRLGHPSGEGVPERAPSVWLPSGTRKLCIFGDNGSAGHAAADFAAAWWRRQGLRATVRYPDAKYTDWNEQLCGSVAR